MIDFHTHILPGMDDGARNVEESIALLLEERRQGAGHIFLTPHFYADEDNPTDFLARRAEAHAELTAAMRAEKSLQTAAPRLYLGAEVYYFPGISDCEEIRALSLANTGCILIEPPMTAWTESMLEDVEAIGSNFGLVPVIAHVDRYCRMLRDDTLFDRVCQRKILTQVNGSYFLREETRERAFRLLEEGRVHMLGSDCHNSDTRAPNLGKACRTAAEAGHAAALNAALEKMYRLIEK